MDQQKRLAFRILASLYPDRRPSEIKKIIDDALAKEERTEDIELWMALTNDKPKEEKVVVEKKIIEEHHYHDHYPWYYNNTITTTPGIEKYTITCGDTFTVSDSASSAISCITSLDTDIPCSLTL